MKALRFASAALLSAASFAAQATTVDLAIDAWNTAYFGEAGTGWVDDYAFNSPNPLDFTLTLTQASYLNVTDAGLAGDSFQVVVRDALNNVVVNAATSAPGSDTTTDVGVDFNQALANSNFSHGKWLLGPGSYTVSGTVLTSAFGAGVAGLSVTAVPEPTTWAAMVAGLFVVGAVARRRA